MLRGIPWRNFDFWLFGAVVLAVAFGSAMIRSAVAGNEEIANLPNRQILFGLIGVVVILVVGAIDYSYWAALRWPIYIVTMVLLFFIFLSARAVFGAARWFQIGTLFVQPTELAKIVLMIILGRYFQDTQDDPRDMRWLFLSFLWVAGLAAWIFLQPNLSNVIVIMVIWVAMLWINGIQIKYLVSFGVVGIVGGLVALFAPFSPLQGYQRDRVFTFLAPDPNASYGATYNVQQALIAIGSGGLFGKGYGHGTQTQLRFLKVRHTDFIFSATSEEFGLMGALTVVAILVFIVYRCIRAARLARDVLGSMIAYGVGILIFFQGAANIAVNLNMIPVSGLPLPFISYGGSGLVSLMLGIGLVESVAMRPRQE
jgi:rod shape determining protein RodA